MADERIGEGEQLPNQPGLLHQEAGEDEQRNRGQGVARDEAEELPEDDRGLEQRVADDEGCRRGAERDADRHREQQQHEQDDADDRHQCVPSASSRCSTSTVRPRNACTAR